MTTTDFATKTFEQLDARERAAVQYGWEPEHQAVCDEIVMRRDARRALGDQFEEFGLDDRTAGIVKTAAKLVERGLDGRCYVRREVRVAKGHRMFREGQQVRGFAFYNAKTGTEAGFVALVVLKTPSAYSQANITFTLGEPDYTNVKLPVRKNRVWRKLAI